MGWIRIGLNFIRRNHHRRASLSLVVLNFNLFNVYFLTRFRSMTGGTVDMVVVALGANGNTGTDELMSFLQGHNLQCFWVYFSQLCLFLNEHLL